LIPFSAAYNDDQVLYSLVFLPPSKGLSFLPPYVKKVFPLGVKRVDPTGSQYFNQILLIWKVTGQLVSSLDASFP